MRIMVGPWLGEVGYEILVWIPYLRTQIGPTDEVLVVSRGGTKAWYDGIATTYVDVYDVCSEEEVRAFNRRRVESNIKRFGRRAEKQLTKLSDEMTIMGRACVRAVWTTDRWIHPSEVFVRGNADWGTYPDPPLRPVPTGGPTAVKFYTTKWLTERDAPVVQRIVDTLEQPIILEHPQVDGHANIPLTGEVRSCDTLATNLKDQTDALLEATSFVGVLGGFAYLSASLGRPTVAYYWPGFRSFGHVALMSERAQRMGVPFQMVQFPAR